MRRSYSLGVALLAALLNAVAAGAQTVDEIVAKNIAAKGGVEKWQSVKSVRMSGTVTLQGRQLPLTVYAKRPNMSRQEITMDDRTIVQAFDGTTPWMMMGADAGAQPIPGPQGDLMKREADFDGALMDYKQKGHTVELVGSDKVDGKPVHHLKVTKKGGYVQHFYLDADTGVELKTTTEIEAGGGKQVIESLMSDHRPVEGITLPHTIKQMLSGTQIVQMTIDKVEINPPLEDSLFRMPGK